MEIKTIDEFQTVTFKDSIKIDKKITKILLS